MRRALLVVAVALGLAAGAGAATTQLPGIPAYAQGYKSWTKLNSKPIPRRSADPHDGTKNVYASKLPRGGRYPVGTVIVKEGFRPGKRYVGLIAVMRKAKSGPHNGWRMIEWVRSSPNARFTEIARGQICYSCHVGARATDYVFTKRR